MHCTFSNSSSLVEFWWPYLHFLNWSTSSLSCMCTVIIVISDNIKRNIILTTNELRVPFLNQDIQYNNKNFNKKVHNIPHLLPSNSCKCWFASFFLFPQIWLIIIITGGGCGCCCLLWGGSSSIYCWCLLLVILIYYIGTLITFSWFLYELISIINDVVWTMLMVLLKLERFVIVCFYFTVFPTTTTKSIGQEYLSKPTQLWVLAVKLKIISDNLAKYGGKECDKIGNKWCNIWWESTRKGKINWKFDY